MNHYVRISLETHLFFARIMKEHAFFLQAGFVQKDVEWIKKADYFRRQFEELLKDTVVMSNRMVSDKFLSSGEMVTKYTVEAEEKTSQFTGIPINSRITQVQQEMQCGQHCKFDDDDVRVIHRLNKKAVKLLCGFIEFKEKVLCTVKGCNLFTANYPLMLEHLIHEAKMYREMIEGMMQSEKDCGCMLDKKDDFWNHIMMEHALFIRGMLDPSEGTLINVADGFAHKFDEVIDGESAKECCKGACNDTLKATCEIRDFKVAGTKGILACEIKSVILPLLADHVTREANHYIRIQEHGYGWEKKK